MFMANGPGTHHASLSDSRALRDTWTDAVHLLFLTGSSRFGVG
jgi:hypothetical protein